MPALASTTIKVENRNKLFNLILVHSIDTNSKKAHNISISIIIKIMMICDQFFKSPQLKIKTILTKVRAMVSSLRTRLAKK